MEIHTLVWEAKQQFNECTPRFIALHFGGIVSNSVVYAKTKREAFASLFLFI